jgi:hypothetical protein
MSTSLQKKKKTEAHLAELAKFNNKIQLSNRQKLRIVLQAFFLGGEQLRGTADRRLIRL